MLQTILGKLYLISLFVTLYVLFFPFLAQMIDILSRREGRAKLAAITELTHFPTMTNTNQRDGAWSDQPGESDPPKQADLPVRGTTP